MLRYTLAILLLGSFASAQDFKHQRPEAAPVPETANGRPPLTKEKKVDPNAQTAVDSLTQVSELFRPKPRRAVGEQGTYDDTNLAPYNR